MPTALSVSEPSRVTLWQSLLPLHGEISLAVGSMSEPSRVTLWQSLLPLHGEISLAVGSNQSQQSRVWPCPRAPAIIYPQHSTVPLEGGVERFPPRGGQASKAMQGHTPRRDTSQEPQHHSSHTSGHNRFNPLGCALPRGTTQSVVGGGGALGPPHGPGCSPVGTNRGRGGASLPHQAMELNASDAGVASHPTGGVFSPGTDSSGHAHSPQRSASLVWAGSWIAPSNFGYHTGSAIDLPSLLLLWATHNTLAHRFVRGRVPHMPLVLQ